jgi:YD repeat-containing protein
LIRTEYADGRVETVDYDATGNRTSMTSPEGAWSWTYDVRNRVVQETQPAAVIEYDYDAVCVFHGMPVADSTPSRSPIPRHAGRGVGG